MKQYSMKNWNNRLMWAVLSSFLMGSDAQGSSGSSEPVAENPVRQIWEQRYRDRVSPHLVWNEAGNIAVGWISVGADCYSYDIWCFRFNPETETMAPFANYGVKSDRYPLDHLVTKEDGVEVHLGVSGDSAMAFLPFGKPCMDLSFAGKEATLDEANATMLDSPSYEEVHLLPYASPEDLRGMIRWLQRSPVAVKVGLRSRTVEEREAGRIGEDYLIDASVRWKGVVLEVLGASGDLRVGDEVAFVTGGTERSSHPARPAQTESCPGGSWDDVVAQGVQADGEGRRFFLVDADRVPKSGSARRAFETACALLKARQWKEEEEAREHVSP